MGQAREFFFKDYRDGSTSEKKFRLDPDDWVELECGCVYPSYSSSTPRTVRLLRKIEVCEGGEWSPYPSVFWVDADEALYTVAILADSSDGSFHIAQSPNGVPDGALMLAAEKAGIHTEMID